MMRLFCARFVHFACFHGVTFHGATFHGVTEKINLFLDFVYPGDKGYTKSIEWKRYKHLPFQFLIFQVLVPVSVLVSKKSV